MTTKTFWLFLLFWCEFVSLKTLCFKNKSISPSLSLTNMTSYTTLVNVDAEAAFKLTSFISQLLPAAEGQQFQNECKTLIDGLKTPELVNKILEQSKFVLALEEENGKVTYVSKFIIVDYNVLYLQLSMDAFNPCSPSYTLWVTTTTNWQLLSLLLHH